MIHSGCERSTFLALLTAVALTALSALPCLAAVSFKPQVNYSSTGVGTIGVATGDFDEDGHPDLVLANRFSTFVSVLRNQGNGTFAAAKVPFPWLRRTETKVLKRLARTRSGWPSSSKSPVATPMVPTPVDE